ncbi:hypothetical protein BDF20DRAFT_885198 [Mycotypha africana]|uniref:uncharacterized protein n=1 Tax=Mycotypha africana TaxID=64632 RepID=UPI002301C5EF|nr:uncharacterized protein BDF20DRAFT_885198 [Mycotypha africana]KAI8971589.1 hypothetical protein BDF20DRAFT_885198 [Mycotypha africana]
MLKLLYSFIYALCTHTRTHAYWAFTLFLHAKRKTKPHLFQIQIIYFVDPSRKRGKVYEHGQFKQQTIYVKSTYITQTDLNVLKVILLEMITSLKLT